MENNIVIRQAEEKDVRQIAEICVEDWQKAYRGIIDSEYLDSLNADNRYDIEIKRYEKLIVAADGDRVLGYAWLEAAADEPADCELIALYVRYAERNRGIGKQLTKALLQYLSNLGACYATLEVRVSNERAQNLYKSLGFVSVGKRKRYYEDNQEDAFLMVCDRLPPPDPDFEEPETVKPEADTDSGEPETMRPEEQPEDE